jgi:hypothetical protein
MPSEPVQIPEGQELQALIIDIQGQFSARKFVEKVRNAYDRHKLSSILGSSPSEKQVTSDKHNFIMKVMSNLFVFPCMDAVEFNLTVRSLSQFLRKNKNIGLVVVDGIHFIENQDFLNQLEKKQAK